MTYLLALIRGLVDGKESSPKKEKLKILFSLKSKEKMQTFEIFGKQNEETENNFNEKSHQKPLIPSKSMGEPVGEKQKQPIVQPFLDAVTLIRKNLKFKHWIETLVQRKALKDYKNLNQRQLAYLGDNSVISSNIKEIVISLFF